MAMATMLWRYGQRPSTLYQALTTSFYQGFSSHAVLASPSSSDRTDAVARRYDAMVRSGVLVHDAAQAGVAARLNELYNSLLQYSVQVDAYNTTLAAYEARRQEAERQVAQDEARQRQEQKGSAAAGVWARVQAGWHGRPSTPTAAQRAAQREARVTSLVGPPPQPPVQPRGLYIWGAVGSGKSLLMDLFYNTVAEEAAVPLHQRLHFNAAMLRVHTILASLDKERAAEEVAAAQRYAEALAAAAAEGGGEGRGLRTPWSILKRDPGVQRQKRARAARLAVRREQRDRLSRSPEEHLRRLAASNSRVLQLAAAGLLHSEQGAAMDGGALAALLRGRHAGLLAFDELQVGDAFNAIALKGVLESLFSYGAVLVSTSNKPPAELNRHGLQEDLFAHFVERLLGSCDVAQLSAAGDYRRGMLDPKVRADPTTSGSYFCPLGPAAELALEDCWRAVAAEQAVDGLAGPPPEGAVTLPVAFGRTLEVPRAVGGAAFFDFDELCNRNVGAADYLALSHRFHTVFVRGLPAMSLAIRHQARRFIVLVDELYNARTRLVVSAEVPPDALFAGSEGEEPIIDLESLQFETEAEGSRLRRDLMADGGVAPVASTAAAVQAAQAQLGGAEEKFMFRRAVSRLYEMQGELYRRSRSRTA